MLRVRRMEGVEGLRRRLAREKFYPHPPAILTPDPSPTRGEGGKREFRQVIPRPDVVFILGGQAKSHPLAWGNVGREERVDEEIRKSNERIFENYNRRKAAAMGGY